MTRRLAALAFLVAVPGATFADGPARPATSGGDIPQVVDDHINRALKEAKLRTAPPADDATVLRRLTLDLNGRIPTLSETTDYLTDLNLQKKTRLVDRLMASPPFVRHQAQEFASFLAIQDVGRRGS